jgi:hypothetical protein
LWYGLRVHAAGRKNSVFYYLVFTKVGFALAVKTLEAAVIIPLGHVYAEYLRSRLLLDELLIAEYGSQEG